jgi:hypothetical protein
MKHRLGFCVWVIASAVVHPTSATGQTPGLFVAVGRSGAAATSPDGISWTPRTGIPSGDYSAIAWGGGQFVAVGFRGAVATSPNGIDWTARSLELVDLTSITYKAPTFVAVGGGFRLASSADGISWVVGWMGEPNSTGYALAVSSSDSVLVALGDKGIGKQLSYASTDGYFWSEHRGPIAWQSYAAPWNGNHFAAVGYRIDPNGVERGAVSTSSDGMTWSQQVMPDGHYFAATWNGSLFVAVGIDVVAYSPDGVQWTRGTIPPGRYRAVAWNGAVFAAVGEGGAVATSADGMVWTAPPSGSMPAGDYYGIVSGTVPLDGPSITNISPNYSTLAGGGSVTVTISGGGFRQGATVRFSKTEPQRDLDAAVTAVNAEGTRISVTAPTSDVPGAFDVVLTNPAPDYKNFHVSGGFTYYAPPSSSGIEPSSGSPFGGTEVTITGNGFRAGATARFGNMQAGVSAVSAKSITAVAPPADAEGIVDVVVTNSPDNQSAILPGAFMYVLTPAISGVSPASGSTLGGTVVTIEGNDFVTGPTVMFGESTATDVAVVSPTRITARSPPHSEGSVDVVVRYPNGKSATHPGGFTYAVLPAPTITSATPKAGVTTGGMKVTLDGTGFVAGAEVEFGGVLAKEVTVVDSTKINVFAPPHAEAEVDILVRNPDGQTGTLSHGFIYMKASGCGQTEVGSPLGLLGFAAGTWVLRRRKRGWRG